MIGITMNSGNAFFVCMLSIGMQIAVYFDSYNKNVLLKIKMGGMKGL